MKIAYFGFDLFYECLEIISQKHKIIKIFTCKVDGDYEKNEQVFSFAKQNNIPITDSKITEEMIRTLEEEGCEIIVSAAYYHRIPVSEKIKSINIHPSLLPEGRGPWPLPTIILKNLKQSGITVHRIAEKFDEGEILNQHIVAVEDDENLDTLTQKMKIEAVKLINETLDDFDFFWQNKECQNNGFYWSEPSVNEMTFTLEDSFEKIDRITRAFYGYHCYFNSENQVIDIERAVCLRNNDIIKNKFKCIFEINDGYLCILK